MSVTSYNHGIEGMMRAKERFGTDFERILDEFDGRYFGFASKSFYAEFLAAREIAESPLTYFPEGLTPEPPITLDSVVLDLATPPVRLARSYGVDLGTLAALNPAWTRRAVRGGAAIPPGAEVWLPSGTLERLASRAQKKAAPSAPKVPAAPDATVHVVNHGENLFRIATVYGVKLTDLLGVNRLTRTSVIHPGQRLLIPR
jgi:membrane-bound lytic murein transglycosylase D